VKTEERFKKEMSNKPEKSESDSEEKPKKTRAKKTKEGFNKKINKMKEMDIATESLTSDDEVEHMTNLSPTGFSELSD